MKRLLSIFILLTTINSFGQSEISVELTNASYKKKNTKLTIDISIKNNTDSVVYIITPKKYFFYKHLDTKNGLNRSGLIKYPYALDITSNKKCKVNDEGYESVMFGREIITFNILDDIDEIKPNETNVYENIVINRFDGEFCSNTAYEVKISYNPIVNFDKSTVDELKTKYDLISKQTGELNYMLSDYLNKYKSAEKDNFEKLDKLFSMIPKIESFNEKTFTSNTIIANEVE